MSSYPELQTLFGAYLNAEWPEEYGTVEAALDAYRAETGAGDRRAGASEATALLHAEPDEARLRRRLTQLGLAYVFDPHESAGDFVRRLRDRLARTTAESARADS